jgi:hypothetical protein
MSFFDGSDVNENYGEVPDGKYVARIKECGKEPNKNDFEIEYIKLVFEIAKGPHAGNIVYCSLINNHPNVKAVNVGRALMKKLCMAALGKPKIDMASELVNKHVGIVVQSNEYKGKTYKNVKEFHPLAAPVKAPEKIPEFDDIPFGL